MKIQTISQSIRSSLVESWDQEDEPGTLRGLDRGLLQSATMSLSDTASEAGLNRKTVRKYLSAARPGHPAAEIADRAVLGEVIDE